MNNNFLLSFSNNILNDGYNICTFCSLLANNNSHYILSYNNFANIYYISILHSAEYSD